MIEGPFFWAAAILLALSAIGLAVYKSWPVLYPQTVERAPLNTACDLRRSACSVGFESGGSVRLDIQPRGIPLLRSLQIQVQLQGLAAPQRIEVDFAGLDMDMGFNRVALFSTDEAYVDQPPIDRSASDELGTYAGRGVLPVCVRDRMAWEARVLLHRPDGMLVAPFRFQTTR